LFVLGCVSFTASQAATNPLVAFPGAEGFGALATGGRGGGVYHVTTLADAGPGSFRDAVSQPHRIVVFDVGGIIRLASNVEVASHLTLAGQTAPGEGICLYGAGVSLGGHENIIVRYLRFRGGIASDRGKKSLGMDKAANIIVDHCSIEWGRWDDLGITVDSHDITIQNCIVAEAIHPQSFGALIDTVRNVTLSHNLWMSNESRNPKAKGTIQYINNVVYNWGETGLCGGHSAADHDLDVIGNYFIKGPSSNDRFAGQFYASDRVFQSGNFIDLDADGQLNGRLATAAEFHRADEKTYTLPTFVAAAALHPPVAVTTDSAPVAYQKIVASAGCSLRRDAVDRRLIAELTSLGRAGKTLPHTDEKGEALVGGLPDVLGGAAPQDSDRDGLPDAWETAHRLDPKNPADATATAPDGYTNLEHYLNSLSPAPAWDG
jgi:pectate lyase